MSADSGLDATGLAPKLYRAQCLIRPGGTPPWPLGDRGGTDPIATQHGPDPTLSAGRVIDLSRIRRLYLASKFRKRGRLDSSGEATAGATTSVGLGLSSFCSASGCGDLLICGTQQHPRPQVSNTGSASSQHQTAGLIGSYSRMGDVRSNSLFAQAG